MDEIKCRHLWRFRVAYVWLEGDGTQKFIGDLCAQCATDHGLKPHGRRVRIMDWRSR